MAGAAHARAGARLYPLASPAARSCARPGCPTLAAATLSFAYGERTARIDDLGLEASPATYDLCADHAGRTRPPHGWQLRDAREWPGAATAHSVPPPVSEDESTSPALGHDTETWPGRARQW